MLEPLLLLLIDHHEAAYGYQLSRGVGWDEFAFIGFAESSVYGALKRFERKGWVTTFLDQDEYHIARYYTLTDRGRERAATRKAELGQAALYALQILELPFVFRENVERCDFHPCYPELAENS